ncbi:hypothetical protein FDP41_009001 [Naegleria fowleri]|uniref:Uncharacterized protein n=1 Tax=Naegleria fowleri TaxID=5763 RepID=A0A6A5BD22_NAEFO|nr:uncharacterized protein FDP41_009001 [Naegleria fowleri]KAF0972752.1 hypothetical protein FDP41_009001 [Naegleria fowleri]CAG4713957.1 unnamed protein product [Naegleria fowleri]
MNHQQEPHSQTTIASSNELLLQTASTIISATQPAPFQESSSILTPSTSSQLGNMGNSNLTLQKTLFRVPMDKLFSIPLESLAHKPQLNQFIIELRSRYVQHLLRTVSSPALHELKKQDNEVFCDHVDEIVKETELLVEDMNFEEYLSDLQSESTTNHCDTQERRYYTTLGRMQLMNQTMKSQRTANSTCFAPSTHDHRPAIEYSDEHEDDDEEYVEEDEHDEYNDEDELSQEEEYMCDDYQTAQSAPIPNETSSNMHCDFSNSPFSITTTPTTNSVNTSPSSSSKLSSPYSNTSNSLIDPIKTDEISRQIQNAEPIPNGSLCFNQHHHIVVGKYDRDLLVKENRLKCCAMKKSTITIYAEKKNNRNGKIMKRERKAKSLLRFYRINVDFNTLVDTFLQKQIYQRQHQPTNLSFTSSTMIHQQRKN